MASNTAIGKAALILTTKDGQLSKGLDGAYSKITGFKNKVTSSFGSLAGGGAFAALAGGSKMFGDALSTIKELDQVGKSAKNLGIASDQFMGLSAAAKRAGVDQGEFTSLLGKQSAKIAAGGSDTAAALAMIGVPLKELQGLSPDKQFMRISDGLKGVSDSGTKAMIATKLYEESGLKLLPVLSQGSEKLGQFIDKQKAQGNALGQPQMDAVMRAQASMPKIQESFSGVWNRVVVAMAPMITSIGGAATKILDKLQPVLDWGGRFAEGYYSVIGPVIGEFIDMAMWAGESVASWVGELGGFAGEWPSIGDVVKGVFKGIGIAGAYTWDTLKAGAGAVAIGFGMISTAVLVVTEHMIGLIDLAAKLPKDLGGEMFAGMAKGARDGIGQAKQSMQGVTDWGKRQIDSFGQSANQVRTWFDKLDAEKQKPEAQIEEAAAPIVNAITDLKYSQNAAVERGSTADYTARVRWEQQSQTMAAQQLELQRRQVTETQGVRQAVERNRPAAPPPPVVVRTV